MSREKWAILGFLYVNLVIAFFVFLSDHAKLVVVSFLYFGMPFFRVIADRMRGISRE